jgi:hypothetical protein
LIGIKFTQIDATQTTVTIYVIIVIAAEDGFDTGGKPVNANTRQVLNPFALSAKKQKTAKDHSLTSLTHTSISLSSQLEKAPGVVTSKTR